MTRYATTGAIAAGLALLLSAPALSGVEEVVELDTIPDDVMELAESSTTDLKLAQDTAVPINLEDIVDDDSINAVYEELGPVTFVGANTETEEDGSFVYEIQGTFEDGRKIEVDIAPEVTVVEIEIEFAEEDVPGAVLEAIKSKLPGFTPEFIEASHSASMKVIGYEFVGKSGDTPMDIEVSADGRTIGVADQ